VEPTTEPVAGDAFGQLLLAQYAELQEPQFELVERDDGFLGVTEARGYFSQREQLGPLEAQACQEGTGRVLDVGCGAGRHSLVMRARGLPVTGLEPFPVPPRWHETAA
jgi:SAM-dependent methyltransferase